MWSDKTNGSVFSRLSEGPERRVHVEDEAALPKRRPRPEEARRRHTDETGDELQKRRRRSEERVGRRRRRSPSPICRSVMSPIRRSPSPNRGRLPSPMRRRSPSPIRRRFPSPRDRRSPSPVRRRSPSPRRWGSRKWAPDDRWHRLSPSPCHPRRVVRDPPMLRRYRSPHERRRFCSDSPLPPPTVLTLPEPEPLQLDLPLVFPDIGGSTYLSVNPAQMGGKGIASLMVLYEYLSLRMLRHRCGLPAEWFLKRIPQPVLGQSHQKRSWYVRRKVDPLAFDLDADQYWKLLNYDETHELSLTSQKVPLYPDALRKWYLDGNKVTEGHPARFDQLNGTFSFITRSHLWCLRPTSEAKSVSDRCPIGKDPLERSVELNADVLNVWLALLHAHFTKQAARRRITQSTEAPKVKEEAKEEQEEQNIKEIKMKEEGAVDTAPQMPVASERTGTLFLSTDFISVFELTLSASNLGSLARCDTASIYGVLEEANWLEPRGPGRIALQSVRTIGSLEEACQKVFRFMRRREYNVWDYRHVVWPVNYMSSHWVLIVADTVELKLYYMDSYSDCYADAHRSHGRSELEDLAAASCGWLHLLCVETYLKFDFRQKHPEATDSAVLRSHWPRLTVQQLPQQPATSLDCGVYAAQFARCIGLYGSPLQCDFDNAALAAMREAMAVCIGAGRIFECPREIRELCAEKGIAT